jgi:hypothetical protein
MARMHPEDIEDSEKATEGEKRVFRFLREAAKPHKDYICWYEAPIGPSGMEPDFILFGKKEGLLILEVKDWKTEQIISYTPFEFSIRVSGRIEKRANPDKQARGYVHALMERLKGIPEFLTDFPGHEGALRLPVGRMVVFPNIQWEAYTQRGLQWLIPRERALFLDDLAPDGDILCDDSGRKFHERISGAFPFLVKGLSPKEIEKLTFVIWPEATIELPVREGRGRPRFLREIQALDDAQSRLALRMGSGARIIKGPPGSGKTIVLVHRCCHLHRYHTQTREILLVCYNIALVSYLKRLIHERGLGVGRNGIHVYHFFELCSGILKEPVHYENEEPEYYELVVHEAQDRILRGESGVGPYDAVLVDEGQDFNDEMLKVILSLLRPGGDLLISVDAYQDLYRRRASFRALGIESGRARYLKKVYRHTAEIFDFTQRFIGETPASQKQLALLPYDFAFHGEMPELRQFRDYEGMEQFLISDLSQSIDRQEYSRSEIAILYDDKVYGLDRFAYDNRSLPMHILGRLEASGIPTTWVSQDVRSKEMYDITTDRVSLISIHSSKGLDFDLVYLIGVDHLHPTRHTRQSLISLVYVAMTRAKYRLVIPYVTETELINRMKDCLSK